MDADILKALAQGGLASALLALIWFVGNRMVRSIDKLDERIAEHTQRDITALAAVATSLTELRGEVHSGFTRVDGIVAGFEVARSEDITPITSPGSRRTHTPVRGLPYGPVRGARDDED